jgi:DNA-binding FadR family transcriptional regulator
MEKTSKHEEIAAGLIQDILTGRYRVGERLPSERDLASRFDANQGSNTEAMKKLEQIGLATVQPGGARVRNKEEASLEVIGHLLAQDNLPDESLVDQILVVMSGLIAIAAFLVTTQGSKETINELRELVKPLKNKKLSRESHTVARLELISRFVQASGNLPLQIIGRALFQEMAPNLSKLLPHVKVNPQAYGPIAEQLDNGLESRNTDAVTAAFKQLYEINKDNMMNAFSEARLQIQNETKEALIK